MGHYELDGAIGRVTTDVETSDTPDGPSAVEWTRVQAGAPNTVLVTSIGNSGVRDAEWHEAVWRGLRHTERHRGFVGRLGRR